MKQVIMVVVAMVVLVVAVATQAAVKELPIVPAISGENATLTIMGEQPKQVDVIIYDDAKGTERKVGNALTFPLAEGESFTFTFSDETGKYWQLVGPNSPVGAGMTVDCSHPGGCKYLRKK